MTDTDDRPSIAELQARDKQNRKYLGSSDEHADVRAVLLEIAAAALAWAEAEVDSQDERRAAGRLHGLVTSKVRP